jgi:predicted GNAT family N-acyltransferase
MDDHDETATHMILRNYTGAIGTLRILSSEDTSKVKIGRMAVLKHQRKTGAGSFLMRAAHEHIKKTDNNIKSVSIHSQIQVVGFYEKLGYIEHGETFVEDGIVHRSMSLDLYK